MSFSKSPKFRCSQENRTKIKKRFIPMQFKLQPTPSSEDEVQMQRLTGEMQQPFILISEKLVSCEHELLV